MTSLLVYLIGRNPPLHQSLLVPFWLTSQTWAILLKVTLTLTFWGYWHWQLTLNWWLLNNWHWHWHWCWSIIMTQHWHWHWHWGQKNIDIDIDIEGPFEKNNWHWHWTLSILHWIIQEGWFWCWIWLYCSRTDILKCLYFEYKKIVATWHQFLMLFTWGPFFCILLFLGHNFFPMTPLLRGRP